MIQLTPVTNDNIGELLPYFEAQDFRLSDFSLGFVQMWAPYAKPSFGVSHDCLCVLNNREEGDVCFTYPLSLTRSIDDEMAALNDMEDWCIEHDKGFVLTAVPLERMMEMVRRYGRILEVTNPRTWRDYLYNFEDFVNYGGKSFSGQRNHVSKFRRLYPEATFRPMTSADEPLVEEFLNVFAERQNAKNSFIADAELRGTRDLMKAFDAFHMVGGLLENDGKVIAITFGEILNDTLVVSVEKALTEYEGAYPTIAQAFAKSLERPGLNYINREDDAGDCGLRKSKLQYNPIRLVDKYTLVSHRMIETLSAVPEMKSLRLTMRAIADADVQAYGRLAGDLARSRRWGWDWQPFWQDGVTPPAQWFLDVARKDFANKAEVSVGLYLEDGTFIGECTYHHFTYVNTVELGVRLLPEYEGQGFASEAMKRASSYALCTWGMDKVTAKCYKSNLASLRMLKRASFQDAGEDETFYYFHRTAKN